MNKCTDQFCLREYVDNTIFFTCNVINFFFSLPGFVMGPEEPTAIQQFGGGPCAVIAPVQAFLLKNLIPNYTMEQLKEVNPTLKC